jgi:hypothetical protein
MTLRYTSNQKVRQRRGATQAKERGQKDKGVLHKRDKRDKGDKEKK